MDAEFEYFEKFIIKQIVNTVDYYPDKDEYELNRIHISDEIIKTIEDEGLRYGLQKPQILSIVSNISGNIKTTPSSKLRYDSIDVGKLKKGQHLRINITHPEKGMRYVELLVISKYRFFLLSSDIMGIKYGDELHSLDKTWNNAYSIDFEVYRNKSRIPNDNTLFRLGKVCHVEMFYPPVINEILDSESSFTFEGKEPTKTAIIEKAKTKNYYFWMPNKWKPIMFCWKEGDIQNENATFILTDSDNATDGKVIINKSFVLSRESEHLDSFMEILFDCCKWKNQFLGIENLKCIRSIKAGIVRKVKDELGSKEWELISQPQIKFIYE